MGRRLGQHFLIRDSVLSRLAAATCPEPERLVIEIGPGKGALTRHLLDHAGRIVAIELDPNLVLHLRENFPPDRVDAVEADVLQVDLGQWDAAAVAGNLPYYITSPVLTKVLSANQRVRRAVFLVQKEVAERVIAGPGSREYGYLSVLCAVWSDVEWLFPVPPAAFSPPPKVTSAALRFHLRSPQEKWGLTDVQEFLRFAASSFRQKRKTLRNNLRGEWPAIENQPESGHRAEALSVEALVDLYHRLRAS